MNGQTGVLLGTLKTRESLSGQFTTTGKLVGEVVIPTSVHTELYEGNYVITPKVSDDVVLLTKEKVLKDNLTVQKIPQYEVSNDAGGKTFIIGDEYYG